MKLLQIPVILFTLTQMIHAQNYIESSVELNSESEVVEIFAEGIISTSLYERDINITPNGDEIIYTIGDFKQRRRFLVQLRKVNGLWTDAEVLNISGMHQDIEPFLTENGQKLFFASNRPIDNNSNRSDYNIWYSKRDGNIWSEPQPLHDGINTLGDEFYPSLSANGNLYFTATRKDGIGKEDIFVSKFVDGKYQNPEVLDSSINSVHYEFNAYINPQENLLIFSSYGRPDEFGGGDLYYSTKDKYGHWSKAINMGEHINSDALDFCPFIDVQRNLFYFSSERRDTTFNTIRTVKGLKTSSNTVKNGLGDIYRIRINKTLFNKNKQ